MSGAAASLTVEVYVPLDGAAIVEAARVTGKSVKDIVTELASTIECRLSDEVRYIDGVASAGIRAIVTTPRRAG